jgi:hypothetical protein
MIMRMHLLVIAAAAVLSTACFDNPTAEYAQRIVGSWRMAGSVMGKPADGMLHILPEGSYILDNGDSARVAKLAPSGEGRWSLLRDELELLAMQASPLSNAGLKPMPVASLHIVALDHQRLVTADPEFGVKVEWVRVNPLN